MKDLAFMITYYYFVNYMIAKKERIDEVLAQVNLLDDKKTPVKKIIKGNETTRHIS